jgi:hypothetical protein
MIITTPHDLPADKPRKRSCGGGFKNLETYYIEEAMIITTPHDLPADKPRKRSCGVALVIAFDMYCYVYIYIHRKKHAPDCTITMPHPRT